MRAVREGGSWGGEEEEDGEGVEGKEGVSLGIFLF